jgi:hypothetical protein
VLSQISRRECGNADFCAKKNWQHTMTCSNGERISSLHRIHEFTGEPLCMSISLLGIVDSSKKRLQCTGCMLQHTKWLLEHLQWLFKSKLCGPFRYSLRFPFQNSHLSRLPSICVKDQNPCCCFSAFVYRIQVPENICLLSMLCLGIFGGDTGMR